MDNENRRFSNGDQHQQYPLGTGLERPPPGLERNQGFNQKQGYTTSVPPGLGPPIGYPPILQQSNNNIFFPPDSSLPPTYSYYPQSQVPFKDAGGITNGNSNPFHQQQQPSNSNYFYFGQRPVVADQKQGRSDSFEPVKETASGVIEPMIENLVGSMGMSNGTYSHFGGPSTTTMLSGLIGSANENGNMGRKTSSPSAGDSAAKTVNTDPFNSSPEWEFQRKMEAKIREKQNLQKHQASDAQFRGSENNNITSTFMGNGNVKQVAENKIKTMGNGQVRRPSATPSPKLTDLSTATPPPETGKPSYLEILTKNVPKENPPSKPRRDTRNNSIKISDEPLFQVQNQAHPKYADGFGSSSPNGSNPSTASSSPITKPRAQQKGKENMGRSGNSSSASSKSSTRRNTPVVTPVHQQNSDGGKKNESDGTNNWVKFSSRGNNNNAKNNGKLISGNGTTGKAGSQFDFEIEDADTNEVDAQLQHEGKRFSGSSKRKDKRRVSANNMVSEVGGGVQSSSNAIVSERRVSSSENKPTSFTSTIASGTYGLSFTGKKSVGGGKEKSEKLRSRKEERNCAIRRLRITSKQWIAHLVKALTWLWSLLVNVTVLSFSLSYALTEDLLTWWKLNALPRLQQQTRLAKRSLNSAWKRLMNLMTRKKKEPSPPKPDSYDEVLSVLGPERNIVLPVTGDEALRRLLSVRGQDPYSILGVRSDSTEETIRRYYKKQAVLVHPDKNLVPGAEEAFKILGKAFEMVGEPGNRMKYTQQLLEAHAKERFIGEFGELFEELRKKMETACSTIRCTKCNVRHKKNKTSRPVFAARFCAQCRIHHGAREGELWAEKSGLFSLSWQFYACMGNQIWEINEWGRCQRSSLKQLKPNAHNIIYRLVSGGQQGKSRCPAGPGGGCNGAPPCPGGGEDDYLLDPEMDDWDSLINNLYRNPGNASNSNPPHSHSSTANKGSSKFSTTNGSANHNGFNSSSATTAPGKKKKGKKK